MFLTPKQSRLLSVGMLALATATATPGAEPSVSRNAGAPSLAAPTNAPAWLTRPLTLVDCLNLALTQNSAIRKSRHDLEAAHGVVVQTRAIVIPKVNAQGNYRLIDRGSIDVFPFPGGATLPYPDQSWSATVQLTQSIYEGGRMTSSLRAARLTRQQALWSHQAVIADTLLEVRVAYADALAAREQIQVVRASVNLLTSEVEDNQRRFDAGTVPRFNLLRAGVELTNALPRLIRAENAYRQAKNNLANLLGYDLPTSLGEDVPLQLAGTLAYEPYSMDLPQALAQALEKRPELAALRKARDLRKEGVMSAQAGYKPSIQLLGGYGGRNSIFTRDLGFALSGWFAGGQFSWDIFDGLLTKGKVDEARARQRKAEEEIADTSRRVELEVRTAYSSFVEAKQVLDAQQQVENLAVEALDLAKARSQAGTGTQLDVLGAETSLTEARTTHTQAVHDYVVARARLEHAVGQGFLPAPKS